MEGTEKVAAVKVLRELWKMQCHMGGVPLKHCFVDGLFTKEEVATSAHAPSSEPVPADGHEALGPTATDLAHAGLADAER
eukprot:3147573-Heterocapsa_arctica.AAC.1